MYRRTVPDFIATWRGKRRESLFIESWTNPPNPPSWFKSVRRATEDEDKRGYDSYLVRTDDSEIPVQIKGTYEGALRYYCSRRPNDPDAAIVIIRALYSEDEVRQITLNAVEALRRRGGLEALKVQPIAEGGAC